MSDGTYPYNRRLADEATHKDEDAQCTPRRDGPADVQLQRRKEVFLSVLAVLAWMGSNMAVLLLNKLLLTFGNFKQPVLLTFLHMLSGGVLTWGLWYGRLLKIQPIRSKKQLHKIVALSLVFAGAVLCANVSLKFLAVSMNQAIGAATPVFAALFALLLQGQREGALTYSTLILVVGGVTLASGVEPNLHVFGAVVCFLGAAFRGLRAVLQAILLKPEEKLDSLSCLAYMAPISSVCMLVLCPVLEPGSLAVLARLPGQGWTLAALLLCNCAAAFASNFFNMVVTKRTSALTIQVLGQCKGVVSAVVSVMCFHNYVPMLGWTGYGVTVVGCFAYGRCKTMSKRALAEVQLREQSLQLEEEEEEEAWRLRNGALSETVNQLELGQASAVQAGRLSPPRSPLVAKPQFNAGQTRVTRLAKGAFESEGPDAAVDARLAGAWAPAKLRATSASTSMHSMIGTGPSERKDSGLESMTSDDASRGGFSTASSCTLQVEHYNIAGQPLHGGLAGPAAGVSAALPPLPRGPPAMLASA